MATLKKLFRCNTLEECRRIQSGYLPLRRLGKWSVLFTVAFALLFNDMIGLCIDRIFSQYEHARGQYTEALGAFEHIRTQYSQATGSVFYRWTIGWFYPAVDVPLHGGLPPEAPKLDERTLSYYRLLNSLQFIFFLACCAYCLRWVYADFTADGKSPLFARFCLVAGITNFALYFGLRIVILHFLNETPNHALQRTAPRVTVAAISSPRAFTLSHLSL